MVIQPKAAKKTQKELPEWKPGGSTPSPLEGLRNSAAVQAKLAIGKPNDRYEQETDRVARDAVEEIQKPQKKAIEVKEDNTATPPIQRKLLWNGKEDNDVVNKTMKLKLYRRNEDRAMCKEILKDINQVPRVYDISSDNERRIEGLTPGNLPPTRNFIAKKILGQASLRKNCPSFF